MIASVPLIIAGYPMINVDFDRRKEYYDGVRRVSGVDTCRCSGNDVPLRRTRETTHR